MSNQIQKIGNDDESFDVKDGNKIGQLFTVYNTTENSFIRSVNRQFSELTTVPSKSNMDVYVFKGNQRKVGISAVIKGILERDRAKDRQGYGNSQKNRRFLLERKDPLNLVNQNLKGSCYLQSNIQTPKFNKPDGCRGKTDLFAQPQIEKSGKKTKQASENRIQSILIRRSASASRVRKLSGVLCRSNSQASVKGFQGGFRCF